MIYFTAANVFWMWIKDEKNIINMKLTCGYPNNVLYANKYGCIEHTQKAIEK